MRYAGIAFALGLSLSVALTGPSLRAQTMRPAHPLIPVDVDVSYNFLRANAGPGECGCFSLNGFNGEGAWRLTRSFRAVAEYGLGHTGAVNQSGHSLTFSTATGGVRYAHRFRDTRFEPFAQGLLGVAHWSGTYFPQGAFGGSGSATSFAYILGGGLDVRLDRRFDVRVLQADFLHSSLPNDASNSQNLLRISAGLVINLGHLR